MKKWSSLYFSLLIVQTTLLLFHCSNTKKNVSASTFSSISDGKNHAISRKIKGDSGKCKYDMSKDYCIKLGNKVCFNTPDDINQNCKCLGKYLGKDCNIINPLVKHSSPQNNQALFQLRSFTKSDNENSLLSQTKINLKTKSFLKKEKSLENDIGIEDVMDDAAPVSQSKTKATSSTSSTNNPVDIEDVLDDEYVKVEKVSPKENAGTTVEDVLDDPYVPVDSTNKAAQDISIDDIVEDPYVSVESTTEEVDLDDIADDPYVPVKDSTTESVNVDDIADDPYIPVESSAKPVTIDDIIDDPYVSVEEKEDPLDDILDDPYIPVTTKRVDRSVGIEDIMDEEYVPVVDRTFGIEDIMEDPYELYYPLDGVKYFETNTCSSKCNGNGLCLNGECFCDYRYTHTEECQTTVKEEEDGFYLIDWVLFLVLAFVLASIITLLICLAIQK